MPKVASYPYSRDFSNREEADRSLRVEQGHHEGKDGQSLGPNFRLSIGDPNDSAKRAYICLDEDEVYDLARHLLDTWGLVPVIENR